MKSASQKFTLFCFCFHTNLLIHLISIFWLQKELGLDLYIFLPHVKKTKSQIRASFFVNKLNAMHALECVHHIKFIDKERCPDLGFFAEVKLALLLVSDNLNQFDCYWLTSKGQKYILQFTLNHGVQFQSVCRWNPLHRSQSSFAFVIIESCRSIWFPLTDFKTTIVHFAIHSQSWCAVPVYLEILFTEIILVLILCS